MRNTATEYALYVRKSRADRELEQIGHEETLARHREALLSYAAEHDMRIGRVYSEIVSGESIAARPLMQELLDDVYAGRWRGVLVMEIERLARGNTRDQGEVTEAFAASNTLIVTPARTYDPQNEMDEEYFEFGLFMSRREYKTIRRRMQRGLEAAIREGNYLAATAPFGYDVCRKNAKERTLAPNDKAQYVRLIYDLYTDQRVGSGAIARRLTEMGVPTATGSPEWTRSTVLQILANPVYMGLVQWGKYREAREKGSEKRLKKIQPESERTLVQGKHPAIISAEQWQRAQEIMHQTTPIKVDREQRNPLAGILRCKHCGRAIKLHGYGARYPARLCHPETKLCHVKSMPAYEVLDAVVGALRAHISDFEMRLRDDSREESRQKAAELRAGILREIEQTERKRNRLFDLLEDGTYSREEFSERRDVLADRLDKLRASLDQIDAEPARDYADQIVRFSSVLDSLLDTSVDARSKNQLLRDVIARIDYDVVDLGRGKGGELHLDLELK